MKIVLLIIAALFFGTCVPELYAQYDMTEEFEKVYLTRQPPDKIMDLIGIRPSMKVGEIGAGRGRITVYMAKAVGPDGKIFANDIDELSLAYLKGRCRRLEIKNVETVKGENDDPKLPENSLDLVVMDLVYHMIEKPDKLLENIKKSLFPGAELVIIDPVDRYIDAEFGIDRSKPGKWPPTIRERINNSALIAGYTVSRVDSSLSGDLVFFLKPLPAKINGGEFLMASVLKKGVTSAIKDFETMRNDTVNYYFGEMEFRKAGYDLIGSRSYAESVALLKMGSRLFPLSSMIYAEMGEACLLMGDREGARDAWQKGAALDPENPAARYVLENFDSIFDQVHPKKK